MKVEIVRKNYDMSEKLAEVITKKTAKLKKYFDDKTVVKVLLKQEKDHCKMEITVTFNGSFIRSETVGDNMYDNIDILLPKIEKQVVKNKEKLHKKFKANAFAEEGYLFLDAAPEPQKPAVGKVKQFEVYPLSVEDAIDQMNMLDHDFFVYRDLASGALKIVYRRGAGDVGVLEPILK